MHPVVASLASETEYPCVSVYLPVLPGLAHAKENINRLSKLLDDVEVRLQTYGISGKARSQFLASARAYADSEFTNGVQKGTVAMFLSPSSFHAEWVEGERSERTVVGTYFYITPLLPYLFSTMHYHILVVSKNHAHLLDVKNGHVEPVDIPDMPHSLAEAWAGTEHTEESLQFHSSGNGTAAFHGQGGAKDQEDIEVHVYLQKIAKTTHTYIHEHKLPVVFAGVEKMYGLYKAIDSSGMLLEKYIHGSPDQMDAKDLVKKAEPIVLEQAEKRKEAMLEAYGNVAGTGKTSTDLGDILDAAVAGKVERLFVEEGAEQWGTFNTESGKKELHEGPEGGNEELLGLAASHTLRHRGDVVSLSAEQMPEGKQIAAILRF